MEERSSYRENLILKVIGESENTEWESAVEEWSILDCEEDEEQSSSCVCGKENIKYLFTIKNIWNGNIIYPIGSSCIKKFERKDLNEIISVKESMFKLLHAVEKDEFITLSSGFFTRNLIRKLYEEGAFKESKYNKFSSKNDYEFLLKMFNKRDKDMITEKQQKKIRALIVGSIKPFLKRKLKDKIRS
ncbi:MAG: hypothetical protein ACRDAU_09015 [Clostridium sp.]